MFLLLAPLHVEWTGSASPAVSWVVLLVTAGSAAEYVRGAFSPD